MIASDESTLIQIFGYPESTEKHGLRQDEQGFASFFAQQNMKKISVQNVLNISR